MCPPLVKQDAAPRALAQLFFTLTQDKLPTHAVVFLFKFPNPAPSAYVLPLLKMT